MKTTTLLPSIRSCVGDWSYYVTTLSFEEVNLLIMAPDEIHERRNLADWIQREAIEKHSDAIATYILNTPQRFLGSLIVGVYGGAPNWTPLKVNIPNDEGVSLEQIQRVEGRLGFLHLSGAEKLFAIDGQHRVAGIKRALKQVKQDDPPSEDSVSAIFVAHDPNESGKERTRRLFTTVNKKAKIISKAAKIALDEDDGFAIVTRRLIDTHWLFEDARKYLLYSSGGSIPATDNISFSSVVGLAEIVKDLYFGNRNFSLQRPNEDALQAHLSLCASFFDELIDRVPEYQKVFIGRIANPGDFRAIHNNHMLFRPIGQRTFARAVQLLLSRNFDVESAVEKLCRATLYLQNEEWHHILWDPIAKTMITNKIVIAEAQLLRLSGERFRNKLSGQKLDNLLVSIGQ